MDYYRHFREKNSLHSVPFIKIPKHPDDKIIVYSRAKHRLDKLSQLYYGNVLYDRFILMANPEYTMEGMIPDKALIRIPFPIERVKAYYNNSIKNYLEIG